ncbi:hypothetical protein G1H11_14065 [Phytoactinopolyspora alkaliphila]|uniref:Uncharacterized protein n=1 Tax=Phytoactinopolyspora alkaliphila TaxID=1783498 RepID=A0A6N9YMY9_9ACTN|nr:hypothetical protein [Phytoactinopolyspora alkaliphila]NED96431.1 hypothetical protein [Phytoactinopolyspora alkaliphila]
MGLGKDRMRPPHLLREQAILNTHWPANPRSYRTHHPGVPVRARVIWERDGVEYVEGVARRWDAKHVYVEILRSGGRLNTNGCWLKPCDVYRSSPDVKHSTSACEIRALHK